MVVPAIITSHNVIIIHNQLIRFPDIAFFTSPIPLHIAGMVILYGHMSKVECLPYNIALEDIWMALDMIPHFRWRWERKDVKGGHPLIAKLAEHVMGVQTVNPLNSHPSFLLCEPDWEEATSPTQKSSQQGTPVLPTVGSVLGSGSGPVYGPSGPINRSQSGGSTPSDRRLAEVPQAAFFPFFPELVPNQTENSTESTRPQDVRDLLRVFAVTHDGYCTQPHEQHLPEEKDRSHSTAASVWPVVSILSYFFFKD